MYSENLKIIFVLQNGYLEAQSLILAKSIRKVYGELVDVYACIPSYLNQKLIPSENTISKLKELHIQILYFQNELSESSTDQRRGNLAANKIFAIRQFNLSDILFLDTDIICNKPIDFTFLSTPCIKIHYEDIDICQITDWERLYKQNDIEYPVLSIVLPLDLRKSPPYFNSGVIYVPGSLNQLLTNEWIVIFKNLSKDNVYASSFFRDQIALSLAIEKLKFNVDVLSENWNFPFNIRKPKNINDIYFIHYHQLWTLNDIKMFSGYIEKKIDFNNFFLRKIRFKIRPFYGHSKTLIYKLLKGV